MFHGVTIHQKTQLTIFESVSVVVYLCYIIQVTMYKKVNDADDSLG